MFDKAQTIIGGVASVFAANGTFYEDVLAESFLFQMLFHPFRTIGGILGSLPDIIALLPALLLFVVFLPVLAALVFDKKKK